MARRERGDGGEKWEEGGDERNWRGVEMEMEPAGRATSDERRAWCVVRVRGRGRGGSSGPWQYRRKAPIDFGLRAMSP